MARAIWKGHISFGLVQIPIGLYTATRDQDLDFNLLDRRDMSPVGYKRVNKRTGEEVPYGEIVKGYEVEEGEYVVLDDEDFRAANVEATQSIDIVAFVDASRIQPHYFVKPYHVVPTKKSAKAYALLRQVMKESGKVGVAKVVLRSRQYVAALVPHERMLVLELLRYADEVRAEDQYDLPGEQLDELGVSERELTMAHQLVEGLSDEWHPEQYHDEYREDLLRVIEEKARTGGTTPKVEVPEGAESAEVVDIMQLLRRSVERVEETRRERSGERKRA